RPCTRPARGSTPAAPIHPSLHPSVVGPRIVSPRYPAVPREPGSRCAATDRAYAGRAARHAPPAPGAAAPRPHSLAASPVLHAPDLAPQDDATLRRLLLVRPPAEPPRSGPPGGIPPPRVDGNARDAP